MNSVIFRPAPACARHARKKFYVRLILWVIGLVAAFSLTFSEQAVGASTFTPIGDNPTIPASLSGVVFYDANQNGKLDNGEYAISGGNIELFIGSNLVATTTVSSVGQYSFNDLTAGTYKLYNTTDGDWLSVPGTIQNLNQPVTSSATGDDMTIDNIVLNAGDQGTMFNFGAQYYPIQLLSKRMLLASSPPINVVPEPGTAVILSFAAIPFIIMAARRRFCQK
ncbi:MAG: SdrD B-like domain-containing protein [Thermoguttaceae bacterium]